MIEAVKARLKLTGSQFRWLLILSATVMLGLVLVLVFLLTQATNNKELYERNYQQLFILNVIVAS